MSGPDVRTWVAASAAHLRARRWREAAASLRVVLVAWPDWSNGWREQGGLASRLNGVEAARPVLARALACGPGDPRTWYLLARTLHASRRFGRASDAACRALLLDPAHPDASGPLAVAAYQLGRFRLADRVLSRARCLRAPGALDLQTEMHACLELGQLARAETVARRLMIDGPADGSALSALVRARHGRRDVDAAWRALRHLVLLQPTDPATLTALSRVNLSRWYLGDAERHARRAIVSGANTGGAYLDLARPLWLRERFEAAELILTRASMIDPRMAFRARILRLTVTKRDFGSDQRNSVSTPV